VLDYQEAHGTGVTPAVVVYERPGGLRPADKAVVRRARASLDAAVARLAGAGAPGPVEFSGNGRAASFSVPIRATTADQVLDNAVKSIRRIVAEGATPAGTDPGRSGLRVAVGGPAGSAADAVNAFAGIDGKLLVITGLIVGLLLLLTYRSPVLWLLPLLSVGMAVSWSQGAAYVLAELGFTVNGMTVGILTVLVFGAGTDYALLLVARYREELHRHEVRPSSGHPGRRLPRRPADQPGGGTGGGDPA
jgi:RND superfamily putative drug exporter